VEVALWHAGDRQATGRAGVDQRVAVQLALGRVHGRVGGEDPGERPEPAAPAQGHAGAGDPVARRPQLAHQPTDGPLGHGLGGPGGPFDQRLGGAGVQPGGGVERLPRHLRVGQVEPPPVQDNRCGRRAGQRDRHRPAGVRPQADRRPWHRHRS
jgi:hypothetical protein